VARGEDERESDERDVRKDLHPPTEAERRWPARRQRDHRERHHEPDDGAVDGRHRTGAQRTSDRPLERARANSGKDENSRPRQGNQKVEPQHAAVTSHVASTAEPTGQFTGEGRAGAEGMPA
jgi:hypothetical protein